MADINTELLYHYQPNLLRSPPATLTTPELWEIIFKVHICFHRLGFEFSHRVAQLIIESGHAPGQAALKVILHLIRGMQGKPIGWSSPILGIRSENSHDVPLYDMKVDAIRLLRRLLADCWYPSPAGLHAWYHWTYWHQQVEREYVNRIRYKKPDTSAWNQLARQFFLNNRRIYFDTEGRLKLR